MFTLIALSSLAACHPKGDDSATPAADARMLVISDSGHGRLMYTNPERNERTGESCLREFLPEDCPPRDGDEGDTASDDFRRCLTFGVTHDGTSGEDVMEVAYARYLDGLTNLPGAVARFVPTHPPTLLWNFDTLTFATGPLSTTCTGPSSEAACGFRMPHAMVAAADPSERIVADTLNSRVVWARPPTTGSIGEGVRVMDGTTPDWGEALFPNNVELHVHDGRTYLLVTYKGSVESVSGNIRAGRILLWDVTDPDAPHRVWAYPEVGYLAASHGGVIRTLYGQEVLIYAHAFGASDDLDHGDRGSVGIARMAWDAPPTYVGDLLMGSSGPTLGFVRAVDVLDPGPTGGPSGDSMAELVVTDSGCENQDGECGFPVGVIDAAVTGLPEPPGLSGAWSADHSQQQWLELGEATDPFEAVLKFPFQALPVQVGALVGVMRTAVDVCP